MHNRINVPLWGMFSILAICLLGIVGWIINIFKLIAIAQATDPNYVMALLRAVGIFVAPLGSILGLFV